MGTKELGKMSKRILTFEEGMVRDRSAREWNIEGETRGVTRKDYKQN